MLYNGTHAKSEKGGVLVQDTKPLRAKSENLRIKMGRKGIKSLLPIKFKETGNLEYMYNCAGCLQCILGLARWPAIAWIVLKILF